MSKSKKEETKIESQTNETEVLDISTQAEFEALKEQYEKLDQKCNSALALAREYKADMERMKDRAKSVEQEKTKEVAEKSVLAFLPVLDNLSLAVSSCKDEKVQKGFALIASSFQKVLEDMGAEQISAEGEFNPELHDCLSIIPAETAEQSGTIAYEAKSGWQMFGKVIRPASVVVYK